MQHVLRVRTIKCLDLARPAVDRQRPASFLSFPRIAPPLCGAWKHRGRARAPLSVSQGSMNAGLDPHPGNWGTISDSTPSALTPRGEMLISLHTLSLDVVVVARWPRLSQALDQTRDVTHREPSSFVLYSARCATTVPMWTTFYDAYPFIIYAK